MRADELISRTLTAFSPETTVSQALDKLEQMNQEALPLVTLDQFEGFITEGMLLDLVDSDGVLAGINTQGKDCYIYSDQHPYDAFRKASEFGSNVVAVLAGDKKYIGTICISDLGRYIGKQFFLEPNSSVIVIRVLERDYSLSELSRLVEANHVKIVQSYVEIDETDALYLLVTLRINSLEFGRVVATLERFGYQVFELFGHSDLPNLDMERLGNLLRFLDI
jgi:hypothetical protein